MMNGEDAASVSPFQFLVEVLAEPRPRSRPGLNFLRTGIKAAGDCFI